MLKITELILNDPSVRYSVKESILKALHRDPVDALNDAELVYKVMKAESESKLLEEVY